MYHESEEVSDAHWKLELSDAWDVGSSVEVSVVMVSVAVALAFALIDSVAEGTGETGSVSTDAVFVA